MNMETITQDERVLKKFPFLKDFPFQEFSINGSEISIMNMDDEDSQRTNIDLVTFAFTDSKSHKFSIVTYDSELEWMSKISEKITDLDQIHSILRDAVISTDLIEKRNFMRKCLEWLVKINDGKATISFLVFSDVLLGLIDHYGVKDTTKFISNLNRLTSNKGVVILSDEEYKTLNAYYDFHFFYTKVMLGIIIASKLSV